jgi:myo-inositol 2-dehydrogenase/D-chiro-inositol 1-dehydrogenase
VSLRFGLAGLGVHGKRYAKHLLDGDVDGATLVAISRQDAQAGSAFATRHGVAFVPQPEALAVHPDVDAVILALPAELHPPVAEACLRAGTPVLVEKPLAPDVASARRIANLASETETPLMVGQTLRFDPLVRRLKEEGRRLGRLRMLALNQRFEPSDKAWLDSPHSGGLFLNTGVHGFDLLRFLTGAEPVRISAFSVAARTRATEDAFVANVQLEPGGILAVVDNARFSESRSGRIELVGDDAQAWGDHIHRTLERVVGRERTDLGPVPACNTLPLVVSAFADCLRHGTAPPVTADDGLAAIQMVQAAALSAREGRPVDIEEVRED